MRLPPASSARMRKGRWSSNNEPSTGHAAGRWGSKDHRREQFHPVSHQLPVHRLAQLTGLKLEAKPAGTIARDTRGAHIAGASPHRLKRLGDPARDELKMARRLGTLPPIHAPLAVLARVMPRLLPRQKLGEHMRLAAARQALVALPPMPRCAIAAVQPDPRARVLRPGALHPRSADPRHQPRLATQPDGSAQREARGGTQLANRRRRARMVRDVHVKRGGRRVWHRGPVPRSIGCDLR